MELGRTIASLAWVAVFIWRGPLRPIDLGLTWRIRPGTGWSSLIAGVILLTVVGAGIVSGGDPGDPDIGLGSFLYQGILGVAAEELVYRGVLLALLVGAVGGVIDDDGGFRWSVRAALVIVGIAGLYALDASLDADGGLSVDIDELISVMVARSVFIWIRLRTGSLLASALVNLGGNVTAFALFAFVL